MEEKEKKTPVGVGYALAQLRRALGSLTGDQHDVDAKARAEKWAAVLAGLADGSIEVGSRTPVAAPAWATLEVVTGGFATGRLLAARPVGDDEMDFAGCIGHAPRTRAQMNQLWLSEAGRARLLDALQSRHYAVTLPEDAALPTLAWLVARGQRRAAAALLEALAPELGRLRLVPTFTDGPAPESTIGTVHLMSVDDVADMLSDRRPQLRVVRMNQTLRVWAPLFDQLAALVLETVDGAAPDVVRAASGEVLRDAKGQPRVQGGWPFRSWPTDFDERVDAALARFDREASRQGAPSRAKDTRGSVQRLASALRDVRRDRDAISQGRATMLRRVLACARAKRGAIGSERHAKLRAAGRLHAERPLHVDLARALVARLGVRQGSTGLEEAALAHALRPVEDSEARAGLPAGAEMPPALAARVARCRQASPEVLIEDGLLRSSEGLALILPQLTANAVSLGVDDPALRALLAATYQAFRTRRSLLLLDLQSQVRFGELPWVAAMLAHRADQGGAAEAAQRGLRDVTRIALRAFPHTQLPNKLVTELVGLARRAGWETPLVRELAADIYMGSLTESFGIAARAASTLGGSLYARYYDVDYHRVTHATHGRRFGRNVAAGLVEYAEERAKEAGTDGGHVARNGAILEQVQIITTHNLIQLLDQTGLRDELTSEYVGMAVRCLDYMVALRERSAPLRRTRLRQTKQCAYAFRQMVLFLSLAPEADAKTFIESAVRRASDPGLSSALRGLGRIAAGERFDRHGRVGDSRRLLGWSCGPHWMLA